MESPDKLHPHDEEQRTYILITGANRYIDPFTERNSPMIATHTD